MIKYTYALILFSFSVIFCNSFENLGEGILIQRNENFCSSEKKIAIATVLISGKEQDPDRKHKGSKYQDIVAFGTRSKEIYAKKHGYDFIIATQKINNCYGVKKKRKLECAWTKLPLISRILEDYDWVFFSDADSIILNFDIKLEDFLDENFSLIACEQKSNSTKPKVYNKSVKLINTGQVFYKNCKFCKELLLGAWNLQNQSFGGFEQSRINHYIKTTKSQNQVLVYPGRAFNAHPKQFKEGDFIVHTYGIRKKELYFSFKKYERKYGYILDEEEKELMK